MNENNAVENDSQEEVAFLPFHAINEFMHNSYRASVIRSALIGIVKIPPELQVALHTHIREHVRVPGFRNSIKAPPSLQARQMVKAFEKDPAVVGMILKSWAAIHVELRDQVHAVLSGFGWDILPSDADRSQLPGFIGHWPYQEDFDKIYQAFQAQYPDSDTVQDDVSLMVVWLSGRLPVDVEEEEEEENDDDSNRDDDLESESP